MLEYYFAQPVYSSYFNSNFIELRYTTHKKWVSNTTTSYGLKNEITERSHNTLVEELYKFSKQVISKHHKVDLKEIWINEYLEKEFQESHNHVGSQFSFTIMHKIPEGSGKLIFQNPYEDFGFNHSHIGFKYFNFQSIPLQEENTILIWPSYMKHMVTPGSNKTKRITYSGNFNIIL